MIDADKLRELADRGPLDCSCHGDPGTCVCSAIMHLCDENKRLRAERLKLDRRIHNQRRSLRETWEIVEMRRKWIGSDSARQKYANLLKRYRALLGRS